jgi:hypothetical protein
MLAGEYRALEFRSVRLKWRSPMTQAATTRLRQPLPLGTAILSHIALSLLLWNLAFRIVGWLLAA